MLYEFSLCSPTSVSIFYQQESFCSCLFNKNVLQFIIYGLTETLRSHFFRVAASVSL